MRNLFLPVKGIQSWEREINFNWTNPVSSVHVRFDLTLFRLPLSDKLLTHPVPKDKKFYDYPPIAVALHTSFSPTYLFDLLTNNEFSFKCTKQNVEF